MLQVYFQVFVIKGRLGPYTKGINSGPGTAASKVAGTCIMFFYDGVGDAGQDN